MYIEENEKDGTFQVRWRDGRGKKKRDKEHLWDNRTDANKRIKELERHNRNNALGIGAEITLEDASVIFMNHVLPKLRNDYARHVCKLAWGQINGALGDRKLHEITYIDIVDYWDSFIKRGCQPSTANKSIMWISNLYTRFRKWNAMVPMMMPEKVSLCDYNPVEIAEEFMGEEKRSEEGLKRKRRLNRAEMLQMKEWCLRNPRNLEGAPEFWETIKKAMLYTVRKSDLLALKPNSKVAGIQGKSQRPFNLPLINHEAITFDGTTMRTLWDRLREDLKWDKVGTPLHTTWHDLRHCGPGFLASMGYSSKIIQEILGHASEAQSKAYTQVFDHELAPAMEDLRKELDSI